ncbi:hypothetical protein LTR78_002848 [Recurvomyces mirabilis]|uniref:FHA domain-containing protein n=1 Tax=Recurvomyces mirabilis TaxID=574656 RepID=A0AAE0WSL6_9PEZI|nr:hypothetical protein LTR78_002848 [Recurvomyces mirabilis]KAK5159419.1 hypothetical protein LTS14_002561 [Recurvomyces mirabilis]
MASPGDDRSATTRRRRDYQSRSTESSSDAPRPSRETGKERRRNGDEKQGTRRDREESHEDNESSRRRSPCPRAYDAPRSDRRDYDQCDHRDEKSHYSKRSDSPPAKRRRRSYSTSRSPPRKSRAPLPSQDDSFRGEKVIEGGAPAVEKQKPNFKPTGLLAKEANTIAGTTTVLKYHEPPEARKPPSKEQWRMYIFKGKDLLDTIYLHQKSVWLCGRDQKITDLLLEHPSISKQHAVIQFRYITSTNEFGDRSSKVKPYLIDLDSANGTILNGEKVGGSRYMELLDGDVVKFGESERESRSGTPNSTTTSMSELSTVAIKDGHRGHLPHYHMHNQGQPSGLSHQLDAERADRISRLAGLERVTTARNPTPQNLTPGYAAPTHQQPTSNPPVSYFDSTGNPAIGRERSTVGSASATGSVGARTTWAGSEVGDVDKMSESQDQDMDMDTSSVGGMSEEGTGSLVGFGEGARTPARQSIISNPNQMAKGSTPTARDTRMAGESAMGGGYDQQGMEGVEPGRRNFASTGGVEQAERIVREHMDTTSNDRMREGNVQAAELGKFGFEK